MCDNCAVKCILQAVNKLETALKLDDSRSETLWCLGNAYTSEVTAFSMCQACDALLFYGFWNLEIRWSNTHFSSVVGLPGEQRTDCQGLFQEGLSLL